MDHSSELEAISETVVKYKVWKTHVYNAMIEDFGGERGMTLVGH